MKVLSVASEAFPLVKTGGLADVAGALPAALADHGATMRTLLPGYPAVMAAAGGFAERARWSDGLGGAMRVLEGRHGDLDLLVLDAPHLYDRPGNPYLDPQGRDWPDNAARFAALARAAARIGWGEVDGLDVDVIHAHDWQAALVPAYLRYLGHGRRRPATVLTLHNLAFQGQFPANLLSRIGLPDAAYASDGLEWYGDLNFLKAGLLFADAITTVSPTYAREIRGAADGMGMDAILRWRGPAVSGIVNGIDTTVWDPARDRALAKPYDVDRLADRVANKRAIETAFGLSPDDGPLFCMVSRLTTQKGIDLVVAGLDAIVAAGARLVVLGSGDAAMEQALTAAAARRPDRIGVRIGYDEALSHRLQGGCDAILVPSRFEPCGLTQLYGLRYGCVPVVARVGGLADTVIDANDAALAAGVATGVQFTDLSTGGFVDAVLRAVDLYRRPDAWRRLQVNGMRADVGWSRSATAYVDVYQRAIAVARQRGA